MTDLSQPTRMIDAHQHLWKPSERRYEWLTAAGAPLNADFAPEDVEADVSAAGITATVLVQAADTYEDTFYMLSVASRVPVVRAVVAWVPLDRTDEAKAALDLYSRSPVVRGIRVLNHNYSDPRWLLRDDVSPTVALLAPRGLSLDVVSVSPEHLVMVADLAARHPELTIVLDHLAKPDISAHGWEPWASLIAEVAAHPNVSVKVSGLNTASGADWTWQDWLPYVNHAVEHFGSARMMMGSDWPVSTLAGDFGGVWRAQRRVIGHLGLEQQADILHRTAERAYSFDASTPPALAPPASA
ncbi:amidohydrolase family protein [Salinibacterium sp.]|uniref:amidohydrolase family protein n=1 Tax=Salinibacterium sp. TaxID=1915057 RepID=UPI00286AE04B|nr:amidohydrolase family protein [Salinibacterium sp.]